MHPIRVFLPSPHSTVSTHASKGANGFIFGDHFQAKPIWQSTIIYTNQETPIYYESHLSSLQRLNPNPNPNPCEKEFRTKWSVFSSLLNTV